MLKHFFVRNFKCFSNTAYELKIPITFGLRAMGNSVSFIIKVLPRIKKIIQNLTQDKNNIFIVPPRT